MTPSEQRELGRRMRAGDETARDALIVGMSGLAYQQAARHCDAHREDLFQAGMLGVVQSARTYKPEIGAFTTIAYQTIWQQQHHFLKRQSRSGVTLDVDIATKDTTTAVDDREYTEVTLRKALDAMTPREREVVLLYHRDGWTLQRIGERFGICGECVRQTIKRACRKARKLLAA